MGYCLSCSSTADLTKEYFEKRGIRYVCFHFELGGKDYLDDMGQSMSPERLFNEMAAGAETKTSQVGVGEYMEHFAPILEEGNDLIHICLSSGISGSYNSACLAKAELETKYPERTIYIVDSLAASSGFGLLVDAVADKRDEGYTIDELYAWVEENKLKLNHWFFSSDLTYFIKGGRVSKTSGFIGTVLGICPLLNVDLEGRLVPREKVRTKKKVIKRIAEMMIEKAEHRGEYDGKCYISHSLCEEDAKEVAQLVKEHFPKLRGEVEIFPIGATIGSHTGPGTVALFFWGDKRED